MFELIFFAVLMVSIFGMTFILYRKIPLLLELPETAPTRLNWKEILVTIKNFRSFKGFSFEVFLQKILSKIRVLTLKTDNKTSNWLQRLRKKSQNNKFEEDDNYWQEIRKKTKE